MLALLPSAVGSSTEKYAAAGSMREMAPTRKVCQLLIKAVSGKTFRVDVPDMNMCLDYNSFLYELFLNCMQRECCCYNGSCEKSPMIKSNISEMMFLKWENRVIDESNFHVWVQSILHGKHDEDTIFEQEVTQIHLSMHLRIRGGMADRQNRVGSKFGGGGVSSAQNSERERKERLRQLALESVDLAKDPYLMRNHLGTYECKLCLTLHTNEGNYLAHTQGKKHQAGLAKRAAMEAKLNPASVLPQPNLSKATAIRQARVKIGRPGYQVTKSRHSETNQRCLSFQLTFPQLDEGDSVQPRHRFMSAYEQRVDSPPDRNYQYLLIACHPYETIGFKVPNEPIDKGEGKFVTNWDAKEKTFTLTFYFVDKPQD